MTPRNDRPFRIRNAVTGALWPLPTAAILLAIGLGIGLPVLDELLQASGERVPQRLQAPSAGPGRPAHDDGSRSG